MILTEEGTLVTPDNSWRVFDRNSGRVDFLEQNGLRRENYWLVLRSGLQFVLRQHAEGCNRAFCRVLSIEDGRLFVDKRLGRKNVLWPKLMWLYERVFFNFYATHRGVPGADKELIVFLFLLGQLGGLLLFVEFLVSLCFCFTALPLAAHQLE